MRSKQVLVIAFLSAAALLGGCDSYSTSPIANANATPRSFSMHKTPKPLPELTFQDDRGRPIRLSGFRGKVLVLNVWATWCAPCREEMPTLDRLQAKLGGADFEVVALSVDHTGPEVVRNFFRQIGIRNLRLYIDTTPETMDKLNVPGLPVTLLIDRNGRELGRLIGSTEWDSPEMLRLLQGVIGRNREDRTVALPLRAEALGPPS